MSSSTWSRTLSEGIRTKRHRVFFGLVEDSIPPLLTSDHVTIPTFAIPNTAAQSRGFVTIRAARARHTEKPSFIISRQGTKRSVCDPHWVSSGLTQKNRRGLLRRRCRPLLRAVQKPASAYACILS